MDKMPGKKTCLKIKEEQQQQQKKNKLPRIQSLTNFKLAYNQIKLQNA